jgi:hypothetical protein
MCWRRCGLLCLAVISAGCRPRDRFTHVDAQNPFVMFDNQTGQSCWSGPAEFTAQAMGEFGEGELTPEESAELQSDRDLRTANPAHQPFCKDLK